MPEQWKAATRFFERTRRAPEGDQPAYVPLAKSDDLFKPVEEGDEAKPETRSGEAEAGTGTSGDNFPAWRGSEPLYGASLMIEHNLFGTIRLVRHWGRIGTNGQERIEVFASEAEAGEALEVIAQGKWRLRYRDL
jgi:hypothetical protein